MTINLRQLPLRTLGACLLAALLTYVALSRLVPPYESRTILLLQDGYQGAAMPDLGAGLFAAVQEKSNLRMLRQVILSYETVEELDQKIGFSRFYQDNGNLYQRWLAGTTDPARRVALLEHVLAPTVDDRAGLLLLSVRAPEPAFAQQTAQALVEIAKRRINDLAQAAAIDQIRFLEDEAKRLAAADLKVQQRLLEYQETNQLTAAEIGISLGVAASGGGGAVAADTLVGWQQRLGELQVRRSSLRQSLRDDAPEIQTVDAEIRAVQKQIQSRRGDLLARTGDRPVGRARIEFANLMAEAQMSKEIYLGAMRSIAMARADASRTLKRVDLVQAPTKPEQPERGAVWFNLLVAVLVGGAVWALAGLVRRYVAAHED